MRIVHLFLLCFVASASALAKDLQEECKDGACPMDVDRTTIWQEAMKKMETMVSTMNNNNVILRGYMNLTSLTGYASEGDIYSIENQETAIEIGEAGQLIVKAAIVSYNRDLKFEGKDPETALVLSIEEVITEALNGSTIGVAIGSGQFLEKTEDETEWVSSNVTFEGIKISTKLGETVLSASYESVMMMERGGKTTKISQYGEALEVLAYSDEVEVNATEVVITETWDSLSTMTYELYWASPPPGLDGYIITESKGKVVREGKQDMHFASIGGGYERYVEESLTASVQRKLFRPRQFSLFH